MPEPRYRVESESPKGQHILECFLDTPMPKDKAEYIVSYVEKMCDDSADNLGLRITEIGEKQDE